MEDQNRLDKLARLADRRMGGSPLPAEVVVAPVQEAPSAPLPVSSLPEPRREKRRGETAEEKRARDNSQVTYYLPRALQRRLTHFHHELALDPQVVQEDELDLAKFETLAALLDVGLLHTAEVKLSIRKHRRTR